MKELSQSIDLMTNPELLSLSRTQGLKEYFQSIDSMTNQDLSMLSWTEEMVELSQSIDLTAILKQSIVART
jgi:hypothetical protein